jgi:ABC-type nickel/cobalt efflux system permease component RcnA
MKYFLFVSEIIGFVAISTSAVMVSLAFSFLRLTLSYVLKLIAMVLRFLSALKMKTFQRTTKGGSDWLVVRIGKFSILLGKKNVSKSDS